MSRNPEKIMQDAVVEQACAWQARLFDDELSAAEKAEFLRWLQDSPRNVREYLRQARIAQLMPQALAGLEVEAFDNYRRQTRLPFLVKLAAAAAVCAGLYVGVQHWAGRDTLDIRVAHGDQRTVRLDDGSVMLLNSQSQARIRYSDSERLIELVQGQALFSVAQDKTRPFKVQAGDTEVRALGTQFDVFRRSPGDLTVTVVDGKVAVADPRARAAAAQSITLNAGEQVRVAATAAAPSVSKVDPHVETAWVRREIVFNGRPLNEVAEEFNRYLNVPVVIEDGRLGQTRVSGIFSAYDDAAFIAFLREFDGFEVDVERQAILVRRRTETKP